VAGRLSLFAKASFLAKQRAEVFSLFDFHQNVDPAAYDQGRLVDLFSVSQVLSDIFIFNLLQGLSGLLSHILMKLFHFGGRAVGGFAVRFSFRLLLYRDIFDKSRINDENVAIFVRDAGVKSALSGMTLGLIRHVGQH
jgi:hypothetical protein